MDVPLHPLTVKCKITENSWNYLKIFQHGIVKSGEGGVKLVETYKNIKNRVVFESLMRLGLKRQVLSELCERNVVPGIRCMLTKKPSEK